MSGNSIVLVGGQQSGKSTFTGGLLQHLIGEREQNRTGDYEMLDGDEEDFREGILEQMIDDHTYPDQTNKYAITVRIPGKPNRIFSKEEKLHVYDHGGEVQNQLLGNSLDMVDLGPFSEADGDIDETTFSHEVESNEHRPSDDDRSFLNELYDSYGIMFLFNLKRYKHLKTDPDGDFVEKGLLAARSLETDLVDRKQKKALVVTGCDCISYQLDPDKPELQTSYFNKSMYDSDLHERVEEEFQDIRITNIFNKVERKDNFDLFGVAIPEDPDDEDSLKTEDDGAFVTEGFESVVRWIRK